MTDLTVDSKVVVKIFGEDYPIVSSDDGTYISKVADFVDSRMKEIAKRCRSQARDKVAILTALSIASELFEKSDIVSRAENQNSDQFNRLLARLDGAIRDNSPYSG